jgi:Leucine-rich repeat (LRR) protein
MGKLLLIIIIVIGAAVVLSINKEGTWKCEDGEWVAHGNPTAAKPDKECEEESTGISGYIETLTGALNKAKDLSKQSTTLDLSNRDLEEFPIEILEQTQIKVLDLSDNQLKSIPAEIGKLVNLEELYLANNQLTGALPAEIRKMPNLKILDASGNDLSGIPAEIGQLLQLKIIDFSGNQLNTVPNEIFNLSGSLQEINLAGNKYTTEYLNDIVSKLLEK